MVIDCWENKTWWGRGAKAKSFFFVFFFFFFLFPFLYTLVQFGDPKRKCRQVSTGWRRPKRDEQQRAIEKKPAGRICHLAARETFLAGRTSFRETATIPSTPTNKAV